MGEWKTKTMRGGQMNTEALSLKKYFAITVKMGIRWYSDL